MDELELQEKPGLFTRLASLLSRNDDEEYEEETPQNATRTYPSRNGYKCHITVRRQIVSFEDAIAAATGLKQGEQQILNLTATEPTQRQKIVDFMCGVSFAQDSTWEEIGENIYLLAPSSMYVEVAPANARSSASRN